MFEADLLLLRSIFQRSPSDWATRWEIFNGTLSRHGLTADVIDQGVSDFREAFTAVHQAYARRKGAVIWGDKSPNYFDRLRELSEIFPEACYIVVWRNPVETANSVVRAAAAGARYFRRRGALLRGLIGYGLLKEQSDWLVSRGKNVLQVNYEDLISDPAGIMQDVCEFLGIPYLPETANLQGADCSAVCEFGSSHHALLKGNEIVSGARPNLLSPQTREKVLGYVARWKAVYQGFWPPFPRTDAGASKPGWLRIAVDYAAYRLARRYDRLTTYGFSKVPVSILLKYRYWKYGQDFLRKAARQTSGGSGWHPI